MKEEAVDRNSGGIVLEEALNLSSDRLRDDDFNVHNCFAKGDMSLLLTAVNII